MDCIILIMHVFIISHIGKEFLTQFILELEEISFSCMSQSKWKACLLLKEYNDTIPISVFFQPENEELVKS